MRYYHHALDSEIKEMIIITMTSVNASLFGLSEIKEIVDSTLKALTFLLVVRTLTVQCWAGRQEFGCLLFAIL